jgi:ketopantoate reductase
MKKIVIIGIGGRTGAMFARELKANNFVFGVGRENEIEEIRKGNLVLKINGENFEAAEVEMVIDTEFPKISNPDAIFLCTKNPVGPVVEYYYRVMKERGGDMPILFLPQNGISAGEEAEEALEKVFGDDAKKIKVARISLFNSVEREMTSGRVYLSYSRPIRLSFGTISGFFKIKEIASIFDKTGIEAKEVSSRDVKNMEFSKFFLNLIGMASASHNLSVGKGFEDRDIFKEEVLMLREYIKIVRAKGGNFLNFSHYPVKLWAFLFNVLPIKFLLIFRNRIGRFIDKGRKGKKKDLDEIGYYNGAVVDLGKKIGLAVSINQKIVERVSSK